jgi:hypothetical protein
LATFLASFSAFLARRSVVVPTVVARRASEDVGAEVVDTPAVSSFRILYMRKQCEVPKRPKFFKAKGHALDGQRG